MKQTTKMLSLRTPIPETETDLERLRNMYDQLGIMPYFGSNTRQSILFLDLIKSIGELSPTYGTTIGELNKLIFGWKARIAENQTPGLDEDEAEPLPLATQKDYANRLLEYGVNIHAWLSEFKTLNRYFTDSGNGYLRVKRVEFSGAVIYTIHPEDYLDCAYLIPAKGEEDRNFVLVSPHINDPEKMKRTKNFKVLEVSFPGERLKWQKTAKNTLEALIHVKNDDGSGKKSKYGRTSQISSIVHMYAEYYFGSLTAKIAATDIISKKLIAFQAPEMEAFDEEDFIEDDSEGEKKPQLGKKRLTQFDLNVLRMKEVTTALGDDSISSAIAAIEFPFGGAPPLSIDLEANRDTAFNKWGVDYVARVIASKLGWASDLLGLTISPNGIGGNILKDLLTHKRAVTLTPAQAFWENVINTVLNEINVVEGLGVNYGVKLNDQLQKMIEELSGKTGQQQPGQAVQAVQEPIDTTVKIQM